MPEVTENESDHDDSRLPPIDGNAYSAYITGGREHFERVERAWAVFGRNSSELLGHLQSVETNPLASITLMQDPRGSGDQAAVHRAFWDELDQRLHNLLSSAASLIDHTYPLARFYEHAPEFQAEWETRKRAVAGSPRASFMRTLRNYLVHKGPAPLMQTMRLGPPVSAGEWDHLRIQLSGAGMLQWAKWNATERRFIESFEGGPPIREVSAGYAEDMRLLYQWLFEQFPKLHVPGEVPRHLKEGRANRIVYGSA